MPVNWLWKNRMGYCIQVQKHTYKAGVDIFGNDILKTETRKFKIDLYAGSNCLAVFCYNFREESDNPEDVNPKTGKRKVIAKYRFCGFWNDRKHMENMLGMHPRDYGGNCYSQENDPDDYMEKLVLNTYFELECKEILRCAKEWTKAGIKIELYYEAPKEVKQRGKHNGKK